MAVTHQEAQILTTAAPHLPAGDPVGPRSALVRKLTEAYWREVETVSSFVASATNRDGIRARPIAQCLREAIVCELDHAQCLAIRIKQLHGPVPGPDDFTARKLFLRPPAGPLDSISALTAVIEAETAAIDRDRAIAAVASNAGDWIMQDLAIQLMQEKQTHRRSLQSYVAELAKS
jgi:bacterioferritin